MVARYDDGLGGVELEYLGHLGIGQREVEQLQVLRHAFLVHRLGNDDHAALQQVAQRHLRSSLAVLYHVPPRWETNNHANATQWTAGGGGT